MSNSSKKSKKLRNANGEGTLYEESPGRWRCQISYLAINGEKKRKSFTGKTKTEVRNKRKHFLNELALGRITETTNCTVVDLLKEAAEYDLKIGEIKDSSYVRRLHTIEIVEKSFISSIPICDLTERNINDFLYNLKLNYSNSVIGKVYSALGKAYKIAINKKLLTYNVMDSPFIKKPTADRKDTKVKAFTCEEQKIFLDALKEDRYQKTYVDYNSMLMIELFAGLRMGEICALTPNDIDLENNLIHVKNTITRDLQYHAKIGDQTKTPKGIRDVPINPMLVDTLNKVLKNYKPNKNNLIFYNYKMDRPVSTQQVNDYFHRLCKKSNLKVSGGQHLLRHTFVTRCIEAEIPAEVIMRWAGHKDISVTINTYADVFSKMHNKAIDKFSAYCRENLSA